MSARFLVNVDGNKAVGDTFDWEELPELLDFEDTRQVLILEVGQKHTDRDGDTWERII